MTDDTKPATIFDVLIALIRVYRLLIDVACTRWTYNIGSTFVNEAKELRAEIVRQLDRMHDSTTPNERRALYGIADKLADIERIAE